MLSQGIWRAYTYIERWRRLVCIGPAYRERSRNPPGHIDDTRNRTGPWI